MKAALLLTLSVLSVAQAGKFTPVGSGALLRLPHTDGDAFLWVPHDCAKKACSMMVVSHSRGNTSYATLEKPHLMSFFQNFVEEGVAVLISNDAGPNTWGNEKSLLYLKSIWIEASKSFHFNGKTYALGYSMGGLPASLSVQRQLYPVTALILMDARVNMLGAYGGADASRAEEIKVAYQAPEGTTEMALHDPMLENFKSSIPMMVIGSKDDRTVPFADNGEKFYRLHGNNPDSVKLLLPGGHLHMNRWAPETARDILLFMKNLRPTPKLQEAQKH